MTTLDGSRGPLHLRVAPATGPVRARLVHLHGLGEHGGLYEHLVGVLAPAGIETWLPDAHGHGRSDGERVLVQGVDVLLADARAVVERAAAARPAVPLVLSGHSLGAVTALLLVAEGHLRPPAPVGLVLSALTLGPLDDLRALVADGVDPLTLTKDPSEMTRNEDYARQVRADPLTWQGGIRVETITALEEAQRRLRAAVRPDSVDLPALFVHGEEDDLAPVDLARELAAGLPTARFAAFPLDRHNVLNELDRDDVAAVVRDFVVSVARGTVTGTASGG